MSIESTEMDNNTQLLIKIAKRAGHCAILKHRLAGISVTGSYHESSLIVTHKIDYQAITSKAKHRELNGLVAKVNEKYNQKVLADIVDIAKREELIERGMVAYSSSNGYLLTHTITAKTL